MINGFVDPRFQRVADVFSESFKAGHDLGAACALTIDGQPILDIYGGYTDRKKTQEWQEDTLVSIYSSGKAVVALLVAKAVDEGLLDYQMPLAHYWPEFGQHGKENITLAQVMSHQSGLPGISHEIDPALWLDWVGMCNELAGMKPQWTPGTQNGYHPQTYGFLAGEALRRVYGKAVGQLMRERISEPFGLDIYCGVNDEEIARVSTMIKPTRAPDLGPMNEHKMAAFVSKWASAGGVGKDAWAKAEIPAANMHANASSLTKLISVIACGGTYNGTRMISAEALMQMQQEQIRGDDLVLPFNLSWACGLMRNVNYVYGPVEETVGHSGFGGSCVLADPKNKLSFSFVLNKMSHYLVGDPRTTRLIDAVYACL